MTNILSKEDIEILDGYFRAANYLSVAQLYLQSNPLLKRPLEFKDIKPRLVGHWGTAPGQNFIYAHLNRIIKKYNLNMMYVIGPGHGGQAMISNTYLEGSYSKVYPEIFENVEGLTKMCKRFSFPGGVSSHVAPETPGSINEGGELGYSLVHAYGAVLDNPSLIVTCIVGDGESETGPLSTSWHLNKFINPKKDGVVLPILHLNGYKISNPTILSRLTDEEILNLFKGYGYAPKIVELNDNIHEEMARVLEESIMQIKTRKILASNNIKEKYLLPMIILRTPKGWTGPKVIDGRKIEGSFRAHQVPLIVDKEHPDNLTILENWLKSYKPEELFDESGKLKNKYKTFIPDEDLRMGLNKNANGGLLKKQIVLPNINQFGVKIDNRGETIAQDMKELGKYLRDVILLNKTNFRIFGPDEALSNRLNYIFDVTNREWNEKILDTDEYLNNEGRVIDSFLSEHICEGLLEGYLLTGRYGIFHTYEAFARVIDSMVSQHAKWLKVTKELAWRKPIASLNIILTSHIWQQDHNGYTHQEPGFLNHLATKKKDIANIYLPPDANSLICTVDHCLKTENKINAIVASKHPRPQWLNIEEARKHFENGISIFDWASDVNPDVILTCIGDTPTLEVLAAKTILKKFLPNLKVRVVNVINLMKLDASHPDGLTEKEFEFIFPKDIQNTIVFHGYPSLIKQLIFDRNYNNVIIKGYEEEGTITTPFDMRVQNKIDRFNIVLDTINNLNIDKFEIINYCIKELIKHGEQIRMFGKDLDSVENWKWEN